MSGRSLPPNCCAPTPSSPAPCSATSANPSASRSAGTCCRTPALNGTMNRVTDRSSVREWLTGYEAAWRAPGTKGLAGLFTEDATYLQSPYERPVTGLDAIGRMWEREREGPGEIFTLVTDIVAVDGQVAVVRAEVT